MFSWWNRNKDKVDKAYKDGFYMEEPLITGNPTYHKEADYDHAAYPDDSVSTALLNSWDKKQTQPKWERVEYLKDGDTILDLWSKKMKTDKQTQIAILKRVIENIESDRYIRDGIDFFDVTEGDWSKCKAVTFTPLVFDFEENQYRLTPKTITLANGVVIPKPLDNNKLEANTNYFTVNNTNNLFHFTSTRAILESGYKFIYATKEEAIEASKALFGIKE